MERQLRLGFDEEVATPVVVFATELQKELVVLMAEAMTVTACEESQGARNDEADPQRKNWGAPSRT